MCVYFVFAMSNEPVYDDFSLHILDSRRIKLIKNIFSLYSFLMIAADDVRFFPVKLVSLSKKFWTTFYLLRRAQKFSVETFFL